MYSVQQLLFDSMSYLKQFGEEGAVWQAAVIGPELDSVEIAYTVWLHRPALSARAAETVIARLQKRFDVQVLPKSPCPGRYLFLGRTSFKSMS